MHATARVRSEPASSRSAGGGHGPEDGDHGGVATRGQDREPVAQHQDLEMFGTILTTVQHQQVDHEPDDTTKPLHILGTSEPRPSRRIRSRRSTHPTSSRHPHAPPPVSSPSPHADDHVRPVPERAPESTRASASGQRFTCNVRPRPMSDRFTRNVNSSEVILKPRRDALLRWARSTRSHASQTLRFTHPLQTRD
jgi:hypothetical protein